MEENKQTLYNDELLDILPDGVIIFNINGEVIQLKPNFMSIHQPMR
jgi:PAS domain-containing protein